MAKISKAEAIRLTGVSRATLYRYIKESRISVDPDGTIDTAELLRAGLTLRQNGLTVTHDETAEMIRLTERLIATEKERDNLREQLENAQVEKLKLLDLLSSQMRLLDAPKKSPWWRKFFTQ